MSKATSPSYILTFYLITETFQKHTLDKRFEIARQIYNACLAEAQKRIKKLKQDRRYQETIQQSKSTERKKQLRELRRLYGCSEYSMHTFVQPMQHHYKVNIDSHTTQKIATRAWKAIEKMEYAIKRDDCTGMDSPSQYIYERMTSTHKSPCRIV